MGQTSKLSLRVCPRSGLGFLGLTTLRDFQIRACELVQRERRQRQVKEIVSAKLMRRWQAASSLVEESSEAEKGKAYATRREIGIMQTADAALAVDIH